MGPGKSGIILRSVVFRAAIIKAPAVMVEPGDIVWVDAASNVTIRDFVITGPLPDALFCSLVARTGIRVGDPTGVSSAIIRGNHITEIWSANPALRGCQNGIAILVGRVAELMHGRAEIFNNLIDKYQKNGPTVSNVMSSAEITGNTIRGIGPTNVIAQNGIQVSGGAVATLESNSVTDHIYTPASWVSTGIILFVPGAGVEVERNFVARNGIGVYGEGLVDATIDRNVIRDSDYDGIFFCGVLAGCAATTDNVISNNEIRNNAKNPGVFDAAGITFWDADDNVVRDNRILNNGVASPVAHTDGIALDENSTGNLVRENYLRDNIVHDCHDDTLVPPPPAGPPALNSWLNNDGETDNRMGTICGPEDEDEDDDDDDGDDDDDDDDRPRPDGDDDDDDDDDDD
jgi:hypothetical protein